MKLIVNKKGRRQTESSLVPAAEVAAQGPDGELAHKFGQYPESPYGIKALCRLPAL